MAIQGLEFDKPTLVDGGHEQKAIVNTASGKQPVNAPTVEDIKRIAKGEAETEGDKSYTKAESDAKFLSKTDAASTYYTKTESDEKYATKNSLITTIPSSLEEEQSKTASAEEQEWLESFDALFVNTKYGRFPTIKKNVEENNITIWIGGQVLSENLEMEECYYITISYNRETKLVSINVTNY